MGSEEEEEEKQELMLLDFWPSMFAMRVKIALAEKGITDYQVIDENIEVAKSQMLLEMNPVHKKVPVLVHKGKPVCESMIIVEYIDEVWSHRSRLLPSQPYLKAHTKFWAHFVDQKFFPASRKLWTSTTSESKEEAKRELIESLKMIEKELGEKWYFGGDTFGFMDISLIPFYSWFNVYDVCGKMSIEEECPQIVSWAKRCLQRPSVMNSIPNMLKVSNYILEIRNKYGIY